MHVSKVAFNIKRRAPCEYALGLHTLIVAPNGGGKSSISIAMQLALTGMADDVLGKELVKSGQTLVQLGDANGASATATLSDDTESTWEVVRDGSTVKTASFLPSPSIDPDIVLPLRAVRAAVSGDDKVARATFLRWTSASIAEAEVLVELPSMYHERYKDIAKTQSGTASEVLSAVTAYALERVRAAADEARGQEALLESIDTAGQERPTDEQVKGAQASVQQWETAWMAATRFEAQAASRGRVESLKAALAQAEQALAQAEGNLAACEQALAAESPAPATHPAVLAMAELCKAHPEVLAGPGCPVCGTEVGAVHLAQAGAYYAGIAAPSQPSQAATVTAQWRAFAGQCRQARDSAARDLAAVEALIDSTIMDPGVTAEAAKAGLDQWRAYAAKLEGAATKWEAIRLARDAKAKLDAEIPVMRAFADACKDAVARVFARGVGAFQDKVQRYLPARWSFQLKLRDGDKEVFRPGLVRPTGEFDSILSGTEWDSVQVAMAMAVVDSGGAVTDAKKKGGRKKKAGGTGSETLSVIILSDRDRDEGTLGDLMRAWSSFPGQIIIESTHKPSKKFPTGWTLIEVEPEKPGGDEEAGPNEGGAQPDAAGAGGAATTVGAGDDSGGPQSAMPVASPPSLTLPPGLGPLPSATPAPATPPPPAAPPLTPPPSPWAVQATPPVIAAPDAATTAALVALGYSAEDIATVPLGGRVYAVKYGVQRKFATKHADFTWSFPPPGAPGTVMAVSPDVER